MLLFEELNVDDQPAAPVSFRPLAARMRPRTFDEYYGQQHVIAPGKLLRRAIESDSFTALILHGPPGIGKTSLAELIAGLTNSYFSRLSAVSATVKDVRDIVRQAESRLNMRKQRTILFLDELHRFSRSQQDVLLPDVENGTIRLIGATTENPHHYVVGPLLSRSQVFQLEPLSIDDIRTLIRNTVADERAFPGSQVELDEDALEFWATNCEGDARHVLTALEVAVRSSATIGGKVCVTLETAKEAMQTKRMNYGDDGHYDCASAFIKSMRGSDPDAAVSTLRRELDAWPPAMRERFCLKPRLGSSGRGRVRGRGDDVDTPALRGALTRLADRGGAVLEPWLDRTLDLSVSFHLADATSGPPLALLGTLVSVTSGAGLPLGHRGQIDHRGRLYSGAPDDDDVRLGV